MRHDLPCRHGKATTRDRDLHREGLLNLGLTVLLILVNVLGGVVGATDIDIETTFKGIWAAVGGRVPVRWGGSPLLIA